MSPSFDFLASIGWLIHPTATETFFNDYWEKQPLVVRRNQKNYFAEVLSLDDLDRALTTLNLTYPTITLKNAARDVKPADYTARNGALDVAAVYQLFGEGSTIVFAFLEDVLPALRSLLRGLEKDLSFPLQANAYLTPARAQGARYHFDTHDVFVLQIAGTKHWTMYGTPLELPLNNQDFDAQSHERGDATMEFELQPGDLAYVPRGVIHDARSSEELSLHLTVGILSYRWADLLLEFVADACLKDAAFRKGLPPGFARDGFNQEGAGKIFENLLQRLASGADCGPILGRFADRLIASGSPLLRGQMDQLALADRLRMESIVGVRNGTLFRIEKNDSSISICAFARKVNFPDYVETALRFALSKPRFCIRDLPGNLDDNGKLVLVRRLVREGLMVVHEA